MPPSEQRGKRTGSFAELVLGDEGDVVVPDDEVRDAASGAVRRGLTGAAAIDIDADHVELEEEVRAELSRAGSPAKAKRYEARLGDATRAFERERFADAARILKKMADELPTAASVRELYGLTLYQQGKWRAAAKELEAFRMITGSTEQHPVLADCYRALGDYSAVEGLWTELKDASPSAELVVEGRIVAAGALADQGRLDEGRRLLEQGWKLPKRPRLHHLRRAYALADLYERAGELTRARDLFDWVDRQEPGFADARRRARSLR